MGPRGRGRKPRVGEAMTLPLAARLVSRGRNGAALEILRREARVRAPLSGSRSTSEEGTRRSVRRQVNMVVGQAKISLGVRDPFQEGVPTAGRAATTAGREIRSGLERLDGTSTGHQEEPVTGAQAPRAVTVLAATVLTVATVPMAISVPTAATVVMATSVATAATGLWRQACLRRQAYLRQRPCLWRQACLRQRPVLWRQACLWRRSRLRPGSELRTGPPAGRRWSTGATPPARPGNAGELGQRDPPGRTCSELRRAHRIGDLDESSRRRRRRPKPRWGWTAGASPVPNRTTGK